MTALDVSHLVEATTDSPDLRAFKALVYERAQKGKATYGFCAAIDRELDILGIKKEKQVTVKVTTSHPFILDVKVYPSKLLDKTEEEQKAEIITMMGELSISANGMRATKIQLPVDCIVSMELVTAASRVRAVTGGREARSGYNWWYTSSEGRVLHEVATEGGARWVYTACGNEVARNRLTQTPSHPTDRHCAKCEKVGS